MDEKSTIEYLSVKSGKKIDEIDSLILNKRKKLRMIVSVEAAIKLVARDLGIELPSEAKKAKAEINTEKVTAAVVNDIETLPVFDTVKDIVTCEDGTEVCFTGVVYFQGKRSTFIRRDGTEGAVASIGLLDKSGTKIRLVFWDDKSEEAQAFEIKDLVKASRVRVKTSNRPIGNGNFKPKELHTLQKSTIEKIGSVDILPEKIKVNNDNGKQQTFSDKVNKLPLPQIKAGLYNIETKGTVESKGDVVAYGNGSGKFVKIELVDGESKVKLVLWNDQTELLDIIQENSKLWVKNAYSKDWNGEIELHLSKQGEIEIIS
ncbi:MAG: hypothetical protein ACTSP4_11525 [Candidatus Hodarchaeales archaeon]